MGTIDFDAVEGVLTTWPFNRMEVGEVVSIPASKRKSAQPYCHVYAKRSGRKFQTKTEKATGDLLVKRIK